MQDSKSSPHPTPFEPSPVVHFPSCIFHFTFPARHATHPGHELSSLRPHCRRRPREKWGTAFAKPLAYQVPRNRRLSPFCAAPPRKPLEGGLDVNLRPYDLIVVGDLNVDLVMTGMEK